MMNARTLLILSRQGDYQYYQVKDFHEWGKIRVWLTTMQFSRKQ
jgi:hypothetical protein